MRKMDGESKNIKTEKLEFLKENFPETFSEGKVDFAKLKAALGEDVDLGERYGLSWKGKSKVYATIQQPTTETLHPARDESVNYDDTQNLFIEGDNLEVLKVLQKAYYNKVKMIYIDPPYNTGNDFVYNDKFAEKQGDYAVDSGVTDKEGYLKETNPLCKNSKDGGHYHSNWLNMVYPRLYLARNLLRQDGVIFVSIDDNEVHNLRMIMNEIFGEENSLTDSPTTIIWKRSSSTAGHFANAHEYVLAYSKNKESLDYFRLDDYGNEKIIEHSALKRVSKANPASTVLVKKGLRFEGKNAVFSGRIGESETQDIHGELIFKNGKLASDIKITAGWAMKNQLLSWLKGDETFDSKGQRVLEFFFNKNGMLRYRKERGTVHPKTILPDEVGSTKAGRSDLKSIMVVDNLVEYPKPVNFVKYFISFVCHGDDIVMDFFCGSGTTAQSVMQANADDGGKRKYIMVQLPEKMKSSSEAFKAGYKTVADIAKERIRRAGKKIKEEHTDAKFDEGFKVLKLAPTNFKVWNTSVKDVAELEKQMQAHFDTIKTDVSKEDLLLELQLKSGYEPTTKCVEKGDYYIVGRGVLIICLADEMTQELFTKILAEKPQKIIILDHSLSGNDQLKTNLMLQAKKANIEIMVV